MIRRTLLAGVCASVAALASLAVAASAEAHPLGNFSVSQYAGLTVSRAAIDVDYVLDMAELPTVAQRARYEAAGPAAVCDERAATLELRVADAAEVLTTTAAAMTFPAGQAGLATTRLECRFTAAIAGEHETQLHLGFHADVDRPGVREITVTGDGMSVQGRDIATTSRTSRLNAYPRDPLADPIDQRSVSFVVAPSAGLAASRAPAIDPVGSSIPRSLQARLAGFAGQTKLSFGIGLLAVFIALVLGAGHAAAPGHGKTLMAAYLIGQRGRRKQALILAGTMTATHTAGVMLLGLLITASFTFAPKALYQWLAVANGLIIAAVGIALLRRARRAWRLQTVTHVPPQGASPALAPHRELLMAGSGHRLEPSHHHHHHDGNDHDHDHHHEHISPGSGPKTLAALGFAGGLSPSPSAVVVLLGAAAVGRAWFGVVLVIAYGAGMAATLIGVGMILARFSDAVGHLLARCRRAHWLALLPTASGACVLLAGIALAILAVAAPSLIAQ